MNTGGGRLRKIKVKKQRNSTPDGGNSPELCPNPTLHTNTEQDLFTLEKGKWITGFTIMLYTFMVVGLE